MGKDSAVFIGTILFSLKQAWNEEIESADTNGKELRLNPEWFAGLTPGQRIGALLHEAYHVALRHHERMGDKTQKRWNEACDHSVNILLTKAGYEVPPDGHCDMGYDHKSAEQIYDLLPEEEDEDGNDTGNYPNSDMDINMKGVDKHSKSDIDEMLVRATTAAKMADEAGSIPGEIDRYVEGLLNPELPWQHLLSNFMEQFNQDDYSFAKPNRRFMPDFYMPSLYSESVADIAIAVDASGSVEQFQFAKFLTEINFIKDHLEPKVTTIVDFDTQINNIHHLGVDDSVGSVKFTGGGGTDLMPVFEYFDENPPTVLIVFSDLWCRIIEEDPGYPVIWICTDNLKAKVNFGTLIHFDTSKNK